MDGKRRWASAFGPAPAREPPRITCCCCLKDISYLSEQGRAEHVNRCLDRSAADKEERSPNLPPPPLPSRGDRGHASRRRSKIIAATGGAASAAASAAVSAAASAAASPAASPATATADAQERRGTDAADRGNALAVLMERARGSGGGAAAAAARTGSGGGGGGPRNAFRALMSGMQAAQQQEKDRAAQKAARGKAGGSRGGGMFGKRNPRTCPEYKKLSGCSPAILVDAFQYADASLGEHYVLTHFHADHYGGLDSSFDAGIIYATPTTCALCEQILRVPRSRLRAVELERPFVIPQSGGRRATLTFVDANHCPGAAMVIVEVNDSVLLHTGDMRWDRRAMEQSPSLARLLRGAQVLRGRHGGAPGRGDLQGRIKVLYLDTTYCDENYKLPAQRATIAAVRDKCIAIRRDASRGGALAPRRVLFVFGAYSIGKERVYVEAARALGERIHVSRQRMKMLRIAAERGGFPPCMGDVAPLLSTERRGCGVWVVPLGSLGDKAKLLEMLQTPEAREAGYTEVAAFRPTGWAHGASRGAGRQTGAAAVRVEREWDNGKVRVFGVAYSEHSSFRELCECVMDTWPLIVTPTVQPRASKAHMEAIRGGMGDVLPYDWTR